MIIYCECFRLRARTDFKPVGSQGAFDLIKLLKKLPNLGELRYDHVTVRVSIHTYNVKFPGT